MGAAILTVDDDEIFRRVLRSLLIRDAALNLVGEAENGEDAIRAVSALRPDIVIMDVTMPRLNGLDATRKIKSGSPGTKVVILTVHSEASYEHAARQNGADAFIPKKRLGSELLPTIRHLLERSTDCETTVASPPGLPPALNPVKEL